MKKHVIKLEVTEQELNVILDKKFNNTEMVNAIMMVADEDLTWLIQCKEHPWFYSLVSKS